MTASQLAYPLQYCIVCIPPTYASPAYVCFIPMMPNQQQCLSAVLLQKHTVLSITHPSPATIACPNLGAGDTFILICVHLSGSMLPGTQPLNTHRSSRGPLSRSPPNNTTWFDPSLTMLCIFLGGGRGPSGFSCCQVHLQGSGSVCCGHLSCGCHDCHLMCMQTASSFLEKIMRS